ncbi:MAG: methylmalonyl-CoA carboxyltransferase, partial [Spirochaetales bacterium]|nr:methylmalonyl-CoA carboxyltransferase [Spirochaetales bacterium]
MSNKDKLEELGNLYNKTLKGGGEARLKAQNEKGKLTARQRIDGIVDKDSFIESQTYIKSRANEFGMDKKKFFGDGVVTGSAKVGG